MQISQSPFVAQNLGMKRGTGQSSEVPSSKAVIDATITSNEPPAPAPKPQSGAVQDLVPRTRVDQDLERHSQTLFEKLQNAFGTFEGDENFDSTLDFDKDGEIGPSDFVAVSKLYNMLKPIAPSAKGPSIESTTELTTSDVAPPDAPSGSVAIDIQSARERAFEAFEKSFGSFAGDENYRSEYDFDNDGEVGPGDFSILSQMWNERF